MALKQRALFLLLALLCLAAGGCENGGEESESASDRPNIIFIFTDDHSARAISAYGSQINETPNIDRLAREGMLFRNAFVTNSICAPSRAVILTGMHSHLNGVPTNRERFDSTQTTFPKLLQQAGYQTAIIGKWHLNSDLGSKVEPQPTDQGFDYFYGHNAFQIPTNHNPINIYRNGELLDAQQGYTADLYADEAIAWLQMQDSGTPFFLYLSMAESHTTFENPDDHVVLPEIISKEPLGPLVRHGDDEWGDIVRWTLNALIIAEEKGITAANVADLASAPGKDPEMNRLLGTEGEYSAMIGLDKNWAVNAISAGGNYGELFEAHIGVDTPIGLARGLNALYTEGGLIYSPPYR